jgi:hypothetical protein
VKGKFTKIKRRQRGLELDRTKKHETQHNPLHETKNQFFSLKIEPNHSIT